MRSPEFSSEYNDSDMHHSPEGASWQWKKKEGLIFSRNLLSDSLNTTALSSLINRIHEEDRPYVQFVANRVTNGQETFALGMRILDAQSSIHDAYVRGQILERDEEGAPVRATGTLELLTNRAQTRTIEEFSRLQRVMVQTHLGFWEWELETGNEWWSASMYELLGYSPADFEITYEKWINDLVHPEDRTRLTAAIDQHIQHHAPYYCTFRMRCKSGEYRWFESRGQAQRDTSGRAVRFLGTSLDVTENQQSKESKQYQEFLKREAARLAKIGIWELDTQNEQVTWSEEVYRIHEVEPGIKIEYLEAANFYVEEDFPTVIESVDAAVNEGKSFEYQARIRTAKGNIRWVRSYGEPVANNGGEVTMLRGVFQDITLQKQRELEIIRQRDTVNAHNERLTSFSHIVSHNLRTHTGNLEMVLKLMQEASADELDTYYSMLHQISEKLSDTIGHLNEITDIQNQRELQLTEVDLEATYNGVLSTLHLNIQQAGASIEGHFSEAPKVRANAAYLESIFHNLISNALKYRKADVSLKLSVRSSYEKDRVQIAFDDNGQGIDLERHGDKIFGLYNTFHRHPEAKGVGLFLTRSQVEAMGGQIRVESVPEKGSIFYVSLLKTTT